MCNPKRLVTGDNVNNAHSANKNSWLHDLTSHKTAPRFHESSVSISPSLIHVGRPMLYFLRGLVERACVVDQVGLASFSPSWSSSGSAFPGVGILGVFT